MKKYISIIISIFLCLVLYGCNNTKVTFNYNCPGLSDYKCSVKDKKLNCTFTMPECKDKEFMGWYDSITNGNRINLDKDFEEDTTLYAYWNDKTEVETTPKPVEEKYYRILFSSNGGVGGQTEVLEVKYESLLPEISKEKPIRENYTFMGWYDSFNYEIGKMYYDSECVSVGLYDREEDVILYAGWKENETHIDFEPEPEPTPEVIKYKITFNINGGTGNLPSTQEIEYGSRMPSISGGIPSRSGYTFKGWYDNSDYTKGTQYYNEKNEAIRVYNKKSNITLYAGWSKIVTVFKYTVKFNINNGTGTVPSDVTAILGNAMPAITTSIPTKSGYTFMGWYDNANYLNGTQYYTNQNKSARAYDRMSGITLYAGWKDNSYTVSFSPNGGSGGQVNSVNVKYGSKMPTISTVIPIRDGYTFMGWYDNTDYTKGTQYYTDKCASARTYNKASNTTLYAGWEKVTYNSKSNILANAFDKTLNTNINFNKSGNKLLFGSDYQGANVKKANFTNLLSTINNNNISPDLIMLLGDYVDANEKSTSKAGVEEANGIIRSFNNFKNSGTLYLQGNHDSLKYNPYLINTGAYEADKYIIYAINYDVFHCSAHNTCTILDDYLNSLVNSKSDKPIFIVSHIPLHATSRESNKDAFLMVDTLNKYGDKLNIIVMFAHNHSGTYDRCNGGTTTYFAKGSTMKFRKNNSIISDTIKFTYLNAGYVGSVSSSFVNGTVSCDGVLKQSSNELTMTLFTINNSSIVVDRYSKNGKLSSNTINR